jgi:hypothetical protein
MPARRRRADASAAAPADVEREIAAFIDKFTPEHGTLIRAARAALRARFPTAHELVYDNYNFLVFGFSTTRRPSDAIVSLAAAANGVGLAFPYCGTRLRDPEALLQGSGSQNRFIRLRDATTLDRPAVRDLLDQATALARTPLPAHGDGATVIVSVSAKQRPRRAAAKHGR